MASFLRKHLSAPGLIKVVQQQFSKISDPREFKRDSSISISDHLIAGLAVFGLKCPSLLNYDRKRVEVITAFKKTLY